MSTLDYHTELLLNLFVGGVLATSGPQAPTTPSLAIDAETNISEFTYVLSSAEHAAEPSGRYPDSVLTIPVIYIYSPSGDLVYRGAGDDRVGREDVNEKNRAILQGLPASAEHLTLIKNAPKLKAMLDMVPAFKNREHSVIGDGHYVVYAVIPKVDRVTSTQKAVLAVRDHANGLPVDTLMLRIEY